MPNGFPPQPVFPFGIDSDYSLFLVHNTTESKLTADNQPWADELAIRPVGEDDLEIWPENGFATIEGEILYYDAVETNANGKVCTLKRCARNLGGKKTQFNLAGTDVRGFVMAEHHNQLADTILRVEDFVGENFTDEQATLDWRIRNLRGLQTIFDDHTCVDLTLTFNELSSDPASGTVARYNVEIVGGYNSYRLDFGDGTFTDSSLSGTHTYAPNTPVDPVVTVSNAKCTVVQTPPERLNPTEPTDVPVITDFLVPIPECPDIPPLVLPEIALPSVEINFPPLVLPCLDLSPIGPINIPSIIIVDPPINVPSIIVFTEINIPTLITITDVNIPTLINVSANIPTLITITNVTIPTLITITPPNIPTIITVMGCNMPTVITVDMQPFPTYIYVEPLDLPTVIEVIGCNMPTVITIISPDFATTIEIIANFATTITLESDLPTSIRVYGDFATSIQVYGELATSIRVIDTVPTEIRVVDTIPTSIEVYGDIPTYIYVDGADVPTYIYVDGADVPTYIYVDGADVPTYIYVDGTSIPTYIYVDASDMISVITVTDDIPDTITIDASGVPTTIYVDASGMISEITVVDDIPDTITIDGSSIPTSIALVCCATIITLVDTLPETITVDGSGIPTVIVIDASAVPDTIVIDASGMISVINVVFPDSIPSISVDWNTPPVVSCIVTVSCPSSNTFAMQSFDEEFRDGFSAQSETVTSGDLGIPTEIKLVVPTIPDIRILHDIPLFIDVRAASIPTLIELRSVTPIPAEIRVLHNIPDVIELRATDVPRTIFLKNLDIPDFIELRMADDMPKKLQLELVGLRETIQLVGAPTAIQLVGQIPTQIQLVMPEKPEVEMVYRGDPINVKVQLDMNKLLGESEDAQCVAIVPCNRR